MASSQGHEASNDKAEKTRMRFAGVSGHPSQPPHHQSSINQMLKQLNHHPTPNLKHPASPEHHISNFSAGWREHSTFYSKPGISFHPTEWYLNLVFVDQFPYPIKVWGPVILTISVRLSIWNVGEHYNICGSQLCLGTDQRTAPVVRTD